MTPQELKIIRQQLGLTQAELAEALNYADAMSISRMETGRREIPWHIDRLMRAFLILGGVDLDAQPVEVATTTATTC